MPLPLESIGVIADFMAEYRYLSLFLSVLFTGEAAIMVASMLVEETVFSFWSVYIIIFLAALIADMFWFLLCRMVPRQRLPAYLKRISQPVPVEKSQKPGFIERNIFSLMLFSKFFYGTRLAFTIYLAFSRINGWRFLLYDALGCLVYVYVFMFVGLEIKAILSGLFPNLPLSVIFMMGLVVFVTLLFGINYLKKRFS